jgi:hypothetical protein
VDDAVRAAVGWLRGS